MDFSLIGKYSSKEIEGILQDKQVSHNYTRTNKSGVRSYYHCSVKGRYNCNYQMSVVSNGPVTQFLYEKGSHNHEVHVSKYYFPEAVIEIVDAGVKIGLKPRQIREVMFDLFLFS